METKNIIIIAIVIVILVAMAGLMISSPSHAKHDSKIAIISNETVNNGDNITIKLTSENGTAISGQDVKINITGEKSTHYTSVITNASGIGELKIEENAGNYTIDCSFGGNDNYTGNSTQKKIEVKSDLIFQNVETQETSTVPESSSNSSSSNIHYDKELNVYYNDKGVVVDPDGEHPMDVGSKYSALVERKEKFDRGELTM